MDVTLISDNGDDEFNIWEDAVCKLSQWKEPLNNYPIKKICNIGGWGAFSILYSMIKELDLAVVISKDLPTEIFQFREDLDLYFNNQKDKIQFIREDARYVTEMKKKLQRIIGQNKEIDNYFDLLILSKTLHHLRSGDCRVHIDKEQIDCLKNPEGCLFELESKKIQELFSIGKRILLWELIEPNMVDNDKKGPDVGGHLTRREIWDLFKDLQNLEYKIKFFDPPFKKIPNFNDNYSPFIHPGTMIGVVLEKIPPS